MIVQAVIPGVMTILALCALICLYRVWVGPTLLDRVAAMDAISIIMTTLLVLLSYHTGRGIYLDIALVFGLLLFVDMLIIAKYIETGGLS